MFLSWSPSKVWKQDASTRSRQVFVAVRFTVSTGRRRRTGHSCHLSLHYVRSVRNACGKIVSLRLCGSRFLDRGDNQTRGLAVRQVDSSNISSWWNGFVLGLTLITIQASFPFKGSRGRNCVYSVLDSRP